MSQGFQWSIILLTRSLIKGNSNTEKDRLSILYVGNYKKSNSLIEEITVMRSILPILAFLMVNAFALCQDKKEIGNLVTENIPDIPAELRERMNQYQNARGASPGSWKPDGNGMLMSTRFGETSQIHLITFAGGARKQITFFKEPVGGGSFCPNPAYNGFTFTKDIGGNEFRQLFWFDLNTGKYEMISDGGRTQNTNVLWSESGNRFIYVSTRRTQKDYDLYIADMKNPKDAKPILEKGGSWSMVDWTPDEKKVIVSNNISANKSFLHILDLESGALDQINASQEEIRYGGARFTKDGTGIFYTSDEGTEFQTLRFFNVATKKSEIISKDIQWDVEGMLINNQRSTIVFSVNENGAYKLYTLDMATKKYSPVTGLPTGLLFPADFHPDGKTFSLLVNSAKSPSDIYTYDLQSKKLTQWTYSEVGGLDNSKFTDATLIEYETFDKVNNKPRKIPAFYFKPANPAGKMPVVIEIHGGPEGQAVPAFDPFRSFLVNELGIAVIEPNVRGSSGYGKSFLKLDNGFKREESVQDIGKLLDWIAKQPELDASRIAVSGGSYGGYMVLASMVNFNDRIRCGVDVVGISNFVTFLKNTEDYRKDLRRVEYGDERDAKMNEFLQKISPLNNVDKITKPLFIVQGFNDPRVPYTEAEQMKTKLQEKGRPVWYLLAKDEGHGFRKKENYTFEQLATVLFLQKFLLN
jgi:dipeptidyl aminopeptidase/acylaminoacyl peptidase